MGADSRDEDLLLAFGRDSEAVEVLAEADVHFHGRMLARRGPGLSRVVG